MKRRTIYAVCIDSAVIGQYTTINVYTSALAAVRRKHYLNRAFGLNFAFVMMRRVNANLTHFHTCIIDAKVLRH